LQERRKRRPPQELLRGGCRSMKETAVKIDQSFGTRVLLTILIMLLPSQRLLAADNQYTRPTLSGIKTILVVVETLPAAMTEAGMSAEGVQKDIAAMLRPVGLNVLSADAYPSTAVDAYLYVNINGFKQDAYVYSIAIELHQEIFLIRTPSARADGITWSKRYIGRTAHVDEIRANLEDMIGIFLNAYRSVNSG